MEEDVNIVQSDETKNNKIVISIWSHDDSYIDALYNSDYEFEGQCIDPKLTTNANGSASLSLSLPLYIFDKKLLKNVINPRWTYITQQYKIRVRENEEINEFVLKDYTETHDQNDQLMININAQSLAEFELSQTGYNIKFDENSLYKYDTNVDPNDPDSVPIGVYEPDIHFWNDKLLENSNWGYRVESYYPIDKDMEVDNRQEEDTEEETRTGLKTGPVQFYEDDRIIDYDENNNPILRDKYEVKKRIIKEENSNIFNIAQDLCETFQCWPTFEILYENDKIISRTIVYKNDVPADGKFSINYTTNLQSIQRTVDASQVVTKMYVKTIENTNVDDGIIAISTNPKNYMKENYLLDLSWYMGDKRADADDIENHQLIPSDIIMTFNSDNLATPVIQNKVSENTKDTIATFKKNIRSRNTYIENASLKLSQDQEELINLVTEREYVQSERDAANQTVNSLIDEMALIGNTKLRKEDKACYLYQEDGAVIIRFSEIGMMALPNKGTFTKPTNMVDLNDVPYTENNIIQLSLQIHKTDPIIGSILEARVTNAKIGTEEDYARFYCSFDYDPYSFYKKMIDYWRAKIAEFDKRLEDLGNTRKNGGTQGLIYRLEGQIEDEKKALYRAQSHKQEVIKTFESLFNPFIREGYYENTSFGIYTNKEQEIITPLTENLVSGLDSQPTWSNDYVNFQIPNEVTTTGDSPTSVKLYDVIDINGIEVMSDKPSSANEGFKTYVKGTDYTIEYGETAAEPSVSISDAVRGIFVRFYQPISQGAQNLPITFGRYSKIYIKVRARGSNKIVWEGFINPHFRGNSTGAIVQCYFCPIEQRLTIKDEDIVASSVKVFLNTYKVNYTNNIPSVSKTKYELNYGSNYYVSKETEDGEIVCKITLNPSTNVPILVEDIVNNICYQVQYNQDVTAKYYYNDALEVMKDSSKPLTTYTISVLDLSEAENWLTSLKWYKPKVGTRVPIYDEELRFYGLVGFINSVTFDLLNPQNTQIQITNFKDKFVDLFQKITAATVALQQKEYQYDRSTKIVTSDGAIDSSLLKDTLERAETVIQVSPTDNIVWDQTGIITTDVVANANGVRAKMKVSPKGIFTSTSQTPDGKEEWVAAVTPEGINANQVNMGNLDTQQVQIANGTEPRFLWNEEGIHAYGQDENEKTDYNTYVLLNETGLKFRQLTQANNAFALPNAVQSPSFEDSDVWSYSSTDGVGVFDANKTGHTQERLYGSDNDPLIDVYQMTIGSEDTQKTDNVKLELSSLIENPSRTHQYYYRIYIKINDFSKEIKDGEISEDEIGRVETADIDAGFEDYYNHLLFTQDNQYVRIEGFVTGITDNKFGLQVILPEKMKNWRVTAKFPIVIDATANFGNNIPSLDWFSDLPDFLIDTPINSVVDTYGNALQIDWDGLSIGAQNNVVQLTSKDGFVIYHPSSNPAIEPFPRLQLGQWQENIIDSDGNISVANYYGLRAFKLQHNADGTTSNIEVFKITQDGVTFDFTRDLEQTIHNYAAEAALQAIASTNTSNLIKNSSGYVFEEQEDAMGQPTGQFLFYDWSPLNFAYYSSLIKPISKNSSEKQVIGDVVSEIVTGTVSEHAFQIGGAITGFEEQAGPGISQSIPLASTPGVMQPYTLKFLLKAKNISSTNKLNAVHLIIEDANGVVKDKEGNPVNTLIEYKPAEVGRSLGDWIQLKFTFLTDAPFVNVKLVNASTFMGTSEELTNGIIYLADLMMTSGEDTPAWTVTPGEVYNNHVTIGSDGITVTSDPEEGTRQKIRTVMDAKTFRIETINEDDTVSRNIEVSKNTTYLKDTQVKGIFQIGATYMLQFTEVIDGDHQGVDVTLMNL